MTGEKFTFFWQTRSPFSQWHPCVFNLGGIKYCCTEQYMMAHKAMLFDDPESHRRIMATESPREHKKLGRKVANFDPDVWNKNAKDIVFRGNIAKFTQNEDLKRALLATKGTTLVEASPYDKIWGIGLAEDDPRALKRETWLGMNWLGEILTKVRNKIAEEEGFRAISEGSI